MGFQVGDQVVHWTYGPGEIIQMDQKELSGQKWMYYVVQIRDLTLWVPASETGERCLRFPTPANQFGKLKELLISPGEPLSPDRMERKSELIGKMKDGSLESVCIVIRDLTQHSRTKKMNDYDNAILQRAKSFLLNEWSLSLGIPLAEAEQELRNLLSSVKI